METSPGLVASGALRYVVVGQQGSRSGPGGPGGGAASASQVATERTAWIHETCTEVSGALTALGTAYDCDGV